MPNRLIRNLALSLAVALAGSVCWAATPKELLRPRPTKEATSIGPASAYVEVAVRDDSGQFTMGVPSGPILLYGHNGGGPWSSFSTIQVDGTNYTNNEVAFGTLIQAPTTTGMTNEGIWTVGSTGLKVRQKLTLVTSATTGHQDTCLIQYVVENPTGSSHVVGCRVMLDTDLADEDGAPFQVPGTGSVTSEMQWDGAQIPSYFFVFNDLNNPSVTCQGTLLGGQITAAPDRFQVDSWGDVYGTDFDYTISGQGISDSAYAVYWLNRTVPAGQTITFSTYYGLGGISVDTQPPLATAVTASETLDCVSYQYSPNPFTVSLYMSNTLPGQSNTVTGVTATIGLPAGLALASGSATQTVGDLALNASSLKSWNVTATGAATGFLTYTLTINSSSSGSKTLSRQVYVPAGCLQTCTLSCTATVPATGATGAAVSFASTATPSAGCSGSPTYAWTFGDGGTSTSQNPTHAYVAAGTYTWGLTVSVGQTTCTQGGSIVISGGAGCPNLTLAQVDTSACPTVKAVVAVTDAAGSPIGGLTASDFCLSEDGVPQTISVTQAGSGGGALYVAVNIDNSGSLGSTNFNLEKEATKTFVNLLGVSDLAAIYGFGDGVDLVQDFTSNKTTLIAAIDGYAYQGGVTALYDSIYQSLTNTGTKSGRKAVIVMTDGYNNNSTHSKADVITLAQTLGIPVYPIGFGGPDTTSLTEIATQTGGKYYSGADASALQQILTDIGNYINNQYVISYTTSKSDGQSHALDVCVTHNACTVHKTGSMTCGSASTCPTTLTVNQVDNSSCPTVKAVVTVLNGAGQPVSGLTTPNFCLKEDGASITSFTVSTAVASGSNLYVALNVDNTGSLGSTAFVNEKTAAKAFIALLGGSDQASVYGFTSNVDLVQDFTADKAVLNAAIDAYPYKGGSTAFYDSVYQSLSNTGTRSGRKAVIAMTDGEDNSSSHTKVDLIAYAKALGIPVFTIGFGSPDAATLQEIATQTGGQYFAGADSSSLQQILTSIGTLVNSQYVVTYTTAKTDGLSHAVEVCVNAPGCNTVAGQGSFKCGQGGGACPTLVVSQVDTSTCPTVKAVVTVTGPTGQPVTGLVASNFCLNEDGVSQTFTLSSGASGAGALNVALNIDNTGSLGSTAFGDEKTAAKAFVALLGASDQAAVYGFTSSVDLVQDFTSSKTTLNSAIDAYPYKGGTTAFYDSVYQSLSNTASKTGRKAVIAMTDGEDNASHHTQAELISYAQSLGIPVFTIGFGSANQATLQAIATQTGGVFYVSATSSNLTQILQAIGNVFQSQYVLTYTTAKSDGLPHALDLCLNTAGCPTIHAQGSMTCGTAQGNCPRITLAQTDTSSCPTVKGIVSVTNAQGQPITGLTASNFCVKEDGASISGFTVTTAGASGTNLYVAINMDNTGSLGSTAFGDEKTAAKAFVALIGASDQAAIYGFTSSVDLVQDFTSNKATLNSAIDGYAYKGGSTAFYDSVYQSLTNTATKPGRRAVIAMTDGEDNSSSHTEAQLIAYAQSLGIPVYTIAFGSADQTVLGDIATQTGGAFYTSATSANLQQILTSISSFLSNQYVVSYTTTKTDGSPHALEICVTYGGCTQTARGSFQCGAGGACPTLTIAQVDTASCPAVKSVVSVFDSTGHPVTGLTAQNFCLSEDGFPQPFTVTTAGQSGVGLYVAVNIDNTGSLGSSNFALEKAATKTFVGLLGASDQVAVYGFDCSVDLVIDFTADKNALNAAIDAYSYSGGSTAFYDSTYQSLANTGGKSGRKAVIAMTDGSDNCSSHSKADLINYAKSLGIPIYTIGFGSPDSATMQEIATQTGGKYYLGTDAGALQQILTDIGNLINNQYVITYNTTYTDGSIHDLDICVTYGGCTVHARSMAQCGTGCSVTCMAQAQATASTNVPAAFYAAAVPVNCQTAGTAGFEWDFGDGSGLSPEQAPLHTYAAAGTYTWTLRATTTGAGSCTKSGSIVVTNAACTKPRITAQPRSQIVTAGQPVTLSVAALSTSALSYQWYLGASPTTTGIISGATSSTYTTPAIVGTTQYWVRVSASCGYVNSQTATLSVPTVLQAWGQNSSGQIGDTSTTTRTSPVPVSGIQQAAGIAAGLATAMAWKADGTAWAWGDNSHGQLGDGTTTDRKSAIQVAGLSGITSMAGGYSHLLARKSDGTVWALGYNSDGQLGNGNNTEQHSPVQVTGLTGATAVAAGYNFSMALKSDGTVWCWGDNSDGQLGDNTTTDRNTPVQVTGLTNVTAIAAGRYFAMALKGDGTVWAWGDNSNGNLGDNSITDRHLPVQAQGLSGITSIGAGHYHAMAVRNDGSLWLWGDNGYHQLGDGTTTDRRVPAQLSGFTGAAQGTGGYLHSVARKTDGTVWAWGDNGYGQMGDGTTTDRTTPVQVTAIGGAAALASGTYFNLAIALGVSVAAYPAAGSMPLAVAFSAAATGGTPPYSYAWAFGDGGTGVSSSTSHTYAAAGSYTATVTATDGAGKSAAASVAVTVNSLTVSISGTPALGGVPLPVAFTSTVNGGTSPYTYAWTFGDGGIATTANPSYTYNVGGSFNATLAVTDSAGNTATSNTLIISPRPAIMLAGTGKPSKVLVGDVVTYRANASGGSGYFTGFSWAFGDGGAASGRTATHVFATAGTYNGSVTVTDGGGGSQTQSGITVFVYGPLSVTAGAPSWALKNAPVTFTATTTGGDGLNTYSWTFGDGSSGSGSPATHAYSATGTYTATVTVQDGMGQTASAAVSVKVVDPLSATASGPSSASPGVAVSFSATASGGQSPYTYSWAFGDGGTGTGSPASHTFATSNTYTVTVTAHDALGQTATASVVIHVVPPPVIATFKKASPPFKIIITGSNLQNGIKVYIDGTQWSSVVWKSLTKIQLTGSTLKATVPKGTTHTYRLVNPDGGEASQSWGY